MTHESRAIEAFVETARAFCTWCDGERSTEPRQLHNEATRHLARLFAAALDLPNVELEEYPAAPRLPEDRRRRMYKSFETFPFIYYREVFHPTVDSPEEPVVGDLADDFTDIYIDLQEGLALLQLGNEPAAVWNWRFSFSVHWGRHAASALRALHCYEFPDE